MEELFRIVEEPRDCSYLPGQTAALEMRGITEMTADEHADLLARGYRRFGWQVFRPACPACAQCISVRVLARQFQLNAAFRRVLRKNQHIRAELHPLYSVREAVELYNRYQRFMHRYRGWQLQQTGFEGYDEMFLSGASHLGRQWLYFDGGKLVGVSMMDLATAAASLVYFFYDPDWRASSPGVFSILTQLQYAKQQGLKYVYPGYWIKGCQSMAYKHRFKPYEILVDYVADKRRPVWRLHTGE